MEKFAIKLVCFINKAIILLLINHRCSNALCRQEDVDDTSISEEGHRPKKEENHSEQIRDKRMLKKITRFAYKMVKFS